MLDQFCIKDILRMYWRWKIWSIGVSGTIYTMRGLWMWKHVLEISNSFKQGIQSSTEDMVLIKVPTQSQSKSDHSCSRINLFLWGILTMFALHIIYASHSGKIYSLPIQWGSFTIQHIMLPTLYHYTCAKFSCTW